MRIEPSDDYYDLLGIDVTANTAELRKAWRKLALRWHPDRAGPNATKIFQMLSAAYATLSDPLARAAYDRRRQRSSQPKPNAKPSPPAEKTTAASKPRTESRRRAPSVMLDRLTGDLNTLITLGVASKPKANVIDLFLEADEAKSGGMATISMNVLVECPNCDEKEPTPCGRCKSTRCIPERFSAWLAIPPSATDGEILEPSALLRGIRHPVRFRVNRP